MKSSDKIRVEFEYIVRAVNNWNLLFILFGKRKLLVRVYFLKIVLSVP